MKTSEPLVIGADHAPKIGQIVTIDMEGRDGRRIVSGILRYTRDEFGPHGDLVRTVIAIKDGVVITLDWDGDPSLKALIDTY